MNMKLGGAFIVLFLATLGLALLNKQALLLSIFLIFLAIIKKIIFPIKKEFIWYSIFSFGGGLVEILLVNYVGAWSYAKPQIFNIPIWMVLYWGVLGTTMIVLYEGLTERLE